jgi:hypothetical protein
VSKFGLMKGSLERETGFEPATSSLGSWHSTPELLPLQKMRFRKRLKESFTNPSLNPSRDNVKVKILERFPTRCRGTRLSFRWRTDASHVHVLYIRVKTAVGIRSINDGKHGDHYDILAPGGDASSDDC